MYKLFQRFLRPIDVIVISLVGLIFVLVYFNELFIGLLFALLLVDAIVSLISNRE